MAAGPRRQFLIHCYCLCLADDFWGILLQKRYHQSEPAKQANSYLTF